MKTLRLLPLSLSLGAAFSAPAQADSLVAVYDLARAYDATWQSAKAQYDANLFKAEQAKAGILPQAGLSAGVSRSMFTMDNPVIDRGFNTDSATLSASQPLYRPANYAAYQQGLRGVDLAEAQLLAATQDLIVRVSQAYFDVLAAQDTLAFVQAQKVAVAEQLASAKRNFEVGTSTITDTREAQARYDLVIAQEIAAYNDLRVKKVILDTLAGKTDIKPDPLAVPVNLPAPQPADINAWVQASEEKSPTIRQARSNLEVAQLETEILIAVWPCQTVPPHQQVPSAWISEITRRVSSGLPNETSTWFKTTSLSTAKPAARKRSANNRACRQLRSIISRRPFRTNDRMDAQSSTPRARRNWP